MTISDGSGREIRGAECSTEYYYYYYSLLFLEVYFISPYGFIRVFTLGRGPVILWRMAPGLRAVLGAARARSPAARCATHDNLT